ncbi:exosome complex exonuclease Rrp41 [Candidatus Bathyarchaeota archaeon]|jgi:exosome complex component RRP41|nr:exosome complex exonuclease Rrp41 [Candidatus Bathyarchaeota archaeon]
MSHNKVKKLLKKNGLRLDDRKLDELRSIKIEIGVIEKASGSAYIEWGKNKIMAAIYGPREVHPRRLSLTNKALVRCRYHMTPFSTEDRKRPAPSRREVELSKVIATAVEPIIFTELYPRTGIDIFIEVLESDGGTRCAALTVTSLALADAGIPLKDLVAACAAGKIDGQIVLDMNGIEDQIGEADLPIAITPRNKEITLLQMDGILTQEEFKKALNLAIEGCKKIYDIQKEALRSKYTIVKEETEKIKEEE